MAKKSTKKSMVDSAARNTSKLDDGCMPWLVEGAQFDGIFEIPIVKKPKKIIIPNKLVPFSKRDRVKESEYAVCEYENDVEFKDLLVNPQDYLESIKNFQAFISPDCSIYRDMPFSMQIANIYRNRAIGCYFQKNGVYVIPCVRWGDERTYTKLYIPEKIAFKGVEQKSIVSIGSYGQLKNKVNRYFFEAGLDAMMEELEPRVVLVYSKCPDNIKKKYPETKFVEYEDWTSTVREH